MAVSLGLSLSQGTPNEESRTTTVTARVTINYSGGSYNGNSPSGTLTIDGQTFSFSKSFNYAGAGLGPSTMGSGSTTACTKTITVSYGSASTRTVYASASFASGTASGTVTASNSINLTAISGDDSGGGDSEGGNSGGVHGDLGGDGEYPYSYRFNYIVGEHCSILVHDYGFNQEYVIKESSSSGVRRSTSPGNWAFVFMVDDGYKLNNCSINGIACDSKGNFKAYNGLYNIEVSAVPNISNISNNICIDDKQYECYIDTEYEIYTSYNGNCIFEGHDDVEMYLPSNPDLPAPNYTTDQYKYMGYGDFQEINMAVYFLKFTTCNLGIGSRRLHFSIPILGGMYSGTHPIQYWLVSSDSNYELYSSTYDYGDTILVDENEILSGTFYIHEGEDIELTLNTIDLESNTTYYLILWSDAISQSDLVRDSTQHVLGVPNSISVDYIDEPIVGTESKFEKYLCYIDNGTAWELL